jgi:Ion channel
MKLARANPTDRFGRLLVIITIAFIISGVQQDWATTVTTFVNLVLIVVAFRTTGVRTTMPLASAIAVVATAAVVLSALADSGSNGAAVSSFAQFSLLIFLVVALLRAVLAHDVVSIQTILGAVAAYALIGLAFSWLYLGMSTIDSQQFSFDASVPSAFPEFSFVVLTTVGFGNQVPVEPFAARVTVIEAVIGQIFLATFVARLVTLYPRRTAPPEPGVDSDQAR